MPQDRDHWQAVVVNVSLKLVFNKMLLASREWWPSSYLGARNAVAKYEWHTVVYQQQYQQSFALFAGRGAISEGPLVPVRCQYGVLLVGVCDSAGIWNARYCTQVQLPLHLEGSETSHHDQVHQGVPQVLDAKIKNQPNIQVSRSSFMYVWVLCLGVHSLYNAFGKSQCT